jgi:hypothetical protein
LVFFIDILEEQLLILVVIGSHFFPSDGFRGVFGFAGFLDGCWLVVFQDAKECFFFA